MEIGVSKADCYLIEQRREFQVALFWSEAPGRVNRGFPCRVRERRYPFLNHSRSSEEFLGGDVVGEAKQAGRPGSDGALPYPRRTPRRSVNPPLSAIAGRFASHGRSLRSATLHPLPFSD
jgi:hypothetical protein